MDTKTEEFFICLIVLRNIMLILNIQFIYNCVSRRVQLFAPHERFELFIHYLNIAISVYIVYIGFKVWFCGKM
jgi:hypothetical protein